MSVEDLKKFIQLVKTDEQVAKKAAAIGKQNITGLIAYGKGLKLEFNETDFEAVRKETGVESRELSDTELGNVSGGTPGHNA